MRRFGIKTIATCILMTTCLSVFSSCNDEEEKKDNKQEKPEMVNPYNSAGEFHNLWTDSLSAYLNRYETTHEVDFCEDMDLLIEVSADYMQGKGFDTTGAYVSTKNIISGISDCYLSLLNSSEVAVQVKKEIRRLVGFLVEYQIRQAERADCSAMIAIVKDEENRIMRGQYPIEEEDLPEMLSVTATLKYSLEYWNNRQQASKGKNTIVALADALGRIGGPVMSVLASKAAEKRLQKSEYVAIEGNINDGFVVKY